MLPSDVQMNIRIPEELRVMLDKAAAVSGRTLSGEVTHRLQMSFAGYTERMLEGRRYEEIDYLNERMAICERELAALDREKSLDQINALTQEMGDLKQEIDMQWAALDRFKRKRESMADLKHKRPKKSGE